MGYRSPGVFAGVLLASTLVAGCGGSDSKVESNKGMGQELMELKTSYDKGRITEEEYKKAKKRTMKRYR